MVLSQSVFSQLTVIEIIIGVVIALILVAFWQRFFENLIFNTFKLNRNSTYQTFIIAVTLTVIFIVILNSFNNIAKGLVIGNTSAQSSTFGDNDQNIIIEAVPCDEGSYCHGSCCKNDNNDNNISFMAN